MLACRKKKGLDYYDHLIPWVFDLLNKVFTFY